MRKTILILISALLVFQCVSCSHDNLQIEGENVEIELKNEGHVVDILKADVSNSLEAKRVRKIVKKGCKIINIKHKLHKIKVEKWK